MNHTLNPGRGALVAALAVLASLAVAQTGYRNTGAAAGDWADSATTEPGTIPQARPDPLEPLEPLRAQGALGPIRSEPRPTSHTDPSIRPFLGGPDIRHGLWETRPGNAIAQPDASTDLRVVPPQAE